jgi:hypothetical protein
MRKAKCSTLSIYWCRAKPSMPKAIRTIAHRKSPKLHAPQVLVFATRIGRMIPGAHHSNGIGSGSMNSVGVRKGGNRPRSGGDCVRIEMFACGECTHTLVSSKCRRACQRRCRTGAGGGVRTLARQAEQEVAHCLCRLCLGPVHPRPETAPFALSRSAAFKSAAVRTFATDRGTPPRQPDCVAGHVRLELRNVAANYPFERSHDLRGSRRILATETIRV